MEDVAKHAVLELKNVSKTMGKRKVVDDVSFTINSGEIFGFLGPNGAGKTTTIKMITGLLTIDSGEIFINGKNVKKDFEGALSYVGGIIENPEMYGYLTGRENLKIFGRMNGEISKERIDQVVKLVNLEDRIDDKVKKYSLGMRQRLGVAQALLHSPKVLILDEPTNGLDPIGIKELRNNLKFLAEEEGLAVLVSSHLLSEMELMCDRFGIIDKGRIIDIKSMRDIKLGKAEENVYSIDVDRDDIEETLKIINAYNKELVCKKAENKIQICTNRKTMGNINKILIESGILVYEISLISKTLEDEFIEITKGSR